MNGCPQISGGEPARILIVDDDRHNRDLLEVMLAPEGFVLLTAENGEQALSMVATRSPDLVLLDIMMPGMDGHEVTARIKGNPATKNIPIIMITALDDRGARMRGLSAGAEEFLSKPVDRAELCVRVRNLLRLKAYGDYHDRNSQLLEAEICSRTTGLVESERLYRSTFDAAPVGILHLGFDGRWLRVNQRLCDLLAYTPEELEGTHARDRVVEEAPDEMEAHRRMIDGTLDRHVVDEKRFRRRGGGSLWARVNTSVHRDADGRAQHFISVIEDITERRTLEAQIRQSSKMDAVGKLASGVAHDFNNLLTVILGFAQLLRADDTLASQHQVDLGQIINAAQRASDLTRQLLAFSRQQVLYAKPLDVNRLITETAGMLSRLIGENIEVTLQLKDELPFCFADRGQVEQVVMNLVVNARDAMPNGGHLTIETAAVELENSSFHEEVIVSGSYVVVSISDTGAGMSKETKRRLFEPFYTTKEPGKGTGLGLSTTYGIIKQSKGYIWVYSEIDRGTTFRFYLPRANPDIPVVAAPVVPAEPRLGARARETVLLVEDDAGVRQLSARILERAGYVVVEAENGEQAERVFDGHAGAISLVVTDVVMPVFGGPELVRRLLIKRPGLKVMYISGYTNMAASRTAKFDASAPFLQKPFTAADFLTRVRGVLDEAV